MMAVDYRGRYGRLQKTSFRDIHWVNIAKQIQGYTSATWGVLFGCQIFLECNQNEKANIVFGLNSTLLRFVNEQYGMTACSNWRQSRTYPFTVLLMLLADFPCMVQVCRFYDMGGTWICIRDVLQNAVFINFILIIDFLMLVFLCYYNN